MHGEGGLLAAEGTGHRLEAAAADLFGIEQIGGGRRALGRLDLLEEIGGAENGVGIEQQRPHRLRQFGEAALPHPDNVQPCGHDTAPGFIGCWCAHVEMSAVNR